MVSRDGAWRVEQIRVERGGRELVRLRVHNHGRFMGEAANLEQLARLLPFPLDELVDEQGDG